MSTLRLQQLLAQLDYLPVSFTPADPAPVAAERDGHGPARDLLVAVEHPAGLLHGAVVTG